MDRLTRIAGSFAIVVVAYWMYALLVVQWIEPSVDARIARGIPDDQRSSEQISDDLQIQQLKSLFPPGAWAAWGLTDPKIFEVGQARLIFQEYDNSRPDEGVRISPCLIVFRYEGPAENDDQRLRQSVILEAPEAVLKFDQPLSFTEFKIRRLEHGQLSGKVIIRSDWKNAGPEDDLRIVTQDIEMTEKSIFTPNPVDFRWGRHYGRGRDMAIQLLAGQPTPGGESASTRISGIESFEMRHIDELHLDLGSSGTSPLFNQPQSGSSPAASLAEAPVAASMPVDIECQGPFRFDVVNKVASLRDRVDVRKRNASGPSDQLACDVLSMYFIDRPKDKNAPSPKSSGTSSLDLEVERMEARGNPVLLTAPSQKEHGGAVVARGERMEYNMVANSIALDGGQEVFLQRGPDEIHARALYYKSAGPGRLGQMAATGPGVLRGQSPDRPGQQLEARWLKELRVYPSDQRQVIAIKGGAELKFAGVGQLQAGELFFWLRELPPVPGASQPGLAPDRMLARNNVNMNTEQVACKRVEELTVWFKEAPTAGPASIGGGTPIAALPTQPSADPASSLPAQRFEISGRFLNAEVRLQQPQPVLSNLTIRENVLLKEAQTSEPGAAPFMLVGDRLDAADLSDRTGTVSVTGQRAQLTGRGFGLTGTNIHLDRNANRVWMDGPGQMELPVPPRLQSYGITGPLRVTWRQGMNFDGRTATFSDSVVASTQLQQLATQIMQVQMQRPVQFQQTNMKEPPQVESISCRGGVQVVSRSFDFQQQLTRHDRAQLTDLAVNILSGALDGGPGWINSVYRGAASPLPGQLAPGVVPPIGASGADAVNCLHVDFQRSVTGNVLSRSLTFGDRVKITYGPVDNFDAMLVTDNPDQVGERGMVASCDQLTVSQMIVPFGGRESIELAAVGNTIVEGKEFKATGNRITFDQSKSLLILEGTARSPAVLYRQAEPGAERQQFSQRTLQYRLNTRQVTVGDVRMLEVGQPTTGRLTK